MRVLTKGKKNKKEYLAHQLDVLKNSSTKKSRETIFFSIMLSGVDI